MSRCASKKGPQATKHAGSIETPAPAPDLTEGRREAETAPAIGSFPEDLLLQAEEASRIFNAQAEEATKAMLAELSGEEPTP